MTPDKLDCTLALTFCKGLGPATFAKLFNAFDGDVQAILKQSHSALVSAGVSERLAKVITKPNWSRVEEARTWANQGKRQILDFSHADYPALLRELDDAPPILYCAGDTNLLSSPQLAIIGSRHCTPAGADNARDFARYLSRTGLTITSGMAQGIDSHAHRGALEGSGKTVAVFGTGLDQIYPTKNRQLAADIHETGLIISEFPLGTKAIGSNFPRRNRIISGLSLATLVVEATIRSGSLITAHKAIEQGREVFALPGSIHNPQARGCHQLIRDGARLVEKASDIIDDIGSLLGFVAAEIDQASDTTQKTGENCSPADEWDESYARLLEIMGYDPISIDSMALTSGLTIEVLSSMLLQLELSDYIQPAPGGCYVRTAKRFT